jgi:uncharacterized protein (DUF2267 family)
VTRPSLDVFERAIQKADEWIDDLMKKMGSRNRHHCYQALGVVLHVLRDRLPVDEAVALGAQLPLLLRGLYYQSWDVSVNPEKYRHAVDFLRHVHHGMLQHRRESISTERIVVGVSWLLCEHLSEGEFASIRRALPREIRTLFGDIVQPESALGPDSSSRWLKEERAWEKFST